VKSETKSDEILSCLFPLIEHIKFSNNFFITSKNSRKGVYYGIILLEIMPMHFNISPITLSCKKSLSSGYFETQKTF